MIWASASPVTLESEPVKSILLLLPLLCLFHAGPAFSQPSEVEETQEENAAEQTGEEEEAPDLDSAPIADLDTEEEAEQDSPARFIPSEQISQDLGVSFPADI